MVVCKCRKATKLYCFVHNVPVCGECICFAEHRICVVRTYSEWVIDGEYDWPPNCCKCQSVLEEGNASETTRLGCLHVVHTNCLVSHIKSFPPHTAPAGYVCPACSTSLWPPKNFKDSGSRFHSLLREAILQSGIEKNLFGNHPVVKTSSDPPLLSTSASSLNNGKIVNDGYIPTNGTGSKLSVSDIVEVDVPSSAGNLMKSTSPVGAGATTRKGAFPVDQQSSDVPHYSDDEDGNRKKYSRRGSFRRKFLRALLPFWSSSLPTLPVTAPPRKDALNTDDASEGRLRHKKSRTDPQKILLFIAIIACLATMGILYYRIAQGGFGDDPIDEDQQ
ncbi:zinc finger protein-like 1 homolog isoform X1 [Punica granatum]|uniref:Zinc finger protein-like 1 homolog isoform X1 n=2 Tax=Punica granatum TaxID=22663 RepID=A0A6P8CAU3_PUNGR|nr:zinc finger protein-like 1 homolog isoform X1 [Punica granatum]XP_031380085.1 zinc finger protein-like 1 homolog isoform X1 [Punica granatum]PKI71374.1 hypothetical protein CRG98_008233 [Punica granatum]